MIDAPEIDPAQTLAIEPIGLLYQCRAEAIAADAKMKLERVLRLFLTRIQSIIKPAIETG